MASPLRFIGIAILVASPLPSNAAQHIADFPSQFTDQERAAAAVVSDPDTPAKPFGMVPPAYPKPALQARTEGTVLLEVLVDAKGRAAQMRVLQSVPGLDAAAKECVKHWGFEPGTKDGRPVATIVREPVFFRIGTDFRELAPPAHVTPAASLSAETRTVTTAAPGRIDGSRVLGGLTLDPEGADFTTWVRQWRDEVSRNWTAPQGAGTGIQGFVDVEFDVEQDGHVSSVRIVRSAGVPALDKAAENALRRSALPPLPAEFPAPRATMNVRFHYNEGAGTREETMPLSPALP